MSSTAPVRWGVVGGGMLGATLALRLAARGARVTLLEAAPTLGGLASAWQLGDFVWDRHYHVILGSDGRLRALLDTLGLEKEICWRTTRTGFFVGGRWYSLSNALEYLRFPPLGLIDKLRLGIHILHAARIRDGRPLEQELAVDWLRRWSGSATTDAIWLPLLRAKLGRNATRVSASFIWAIIRRLFGARSRADGREQLGYVPGGYARILAALAAALERDGVEIRCGEPTVRVERDGGELHVTTAAGEPRRFDRVVVTAPAPIAAELLPQLTAAESARLRGIEYQGIVCASLLHPEPLSPYYVTNVTDDWVPFTGVIEMTALVDRSTFGGNSLVYLPLYADGGDDIWQRSDAEIEDAFLSALARMTPAFRRERVVAFRISRARHVMPIPTLGYSDRVPSMSTSVPGLFTVNSSQIINGTLNGNETVELAERALEVIDAR